MCVALLFVLFFINRGSQGRTQTQTLSVWFSASRTEFVVFTEPVAIQANFAVGPQQTCIRFILFTLIFFLFHPESLPLNLRGYVVWFPAYQGENSVCVPQPVVGVALERWGFNWFLPAFVGSSKSKSSPPPGKKKKTSASYRYAHYNPYSCDFFPKWLSVQNIKSSLGEIRNRPLHTQRTGKRQTSPDWQVSGLINKRTHIWGLCWLDTRRGDLHTNQGFNTPYQTPYQEFIQRP